MPVCQRIFFHLLRFSRKRVVKQYIQRNIPRVIQRRFEVAQKILEYLNKNVEFIYIDETGFNQNFSPFYSYSKKGEKSIIKTPPKGDNYSVIAAITSKKFLSYQIFHGSIKADDFGGFVTKIFTEIPELKNKRLNYVIFLDNASIHRANILKPCLRKYHVIYNAPYSPFLNPIEELFGIWKYNFRNLVFDKSKNVVQKITESCTNLDLESISSYFIHSIEFLDDCINKNPIE